MPISQGLRMMVWASTFSAKVKAYADDHDSVTSEYIARSAALEANETVRIYDLVTSDVFMPSDLAT